MTQMLIDPMDAAAVEAAGMMKALSNPGRLRILCALVPQDMTVGELELAVGQSQSYVSGQLLKLRAEGLVAAERDGRIMRYSLADARVRPILERMYEVFCPTPV
ncbi:MAG: metalloregulator ArsR/SmtB family transcription factor [Yoonia sp.]